MTMHDHQDTKGGAQSDGCKPRFSVGMAEIIHHQALLVAEDRLRLLKGNPVLPQV